MCPYKPISDNKKNANYQPMIASETEEANYAPMQEQVSVNPDDTYAPMQAQEQTPSDPKPLYAPMQQETPLANDPKPLYAPMQESPLANNSNPSYAPMQGEVEESLTANSIATGRVKKKKSGQKVTSDSGKAFKVYDRLSEKKGGELSAQLNIQKTGSDTLLGEGQFGQVRIALDRTASRRGTFLAVKIVEEATEAFAKENAFYTEIKAKALEGLLVPVQTIRCIENNTTYQFMPLINFGDGNKLHSLMSELPEADKAILLRHVVRQLLPIFADMQAERVYHLDFKPGNFLLDLKGNVWLSDFGSAIVYNDQKAKEGKYNPVTDVLYWSPEFGQSSLSLGERFQAADNWRMGVTLFQMACVQQEHIEFIEQALLKPPEWRLETSPDAQRRYFKELQPTLLAILAKEKIPSDLQAIILGLMNPNYAERLHAAQAYQLLNSHSGNENIAVTHLLGPKSATIPTMGEASPEIVVESDAIPSLSTMASTTKSRVISRANMEAFIHLIEKMSSYRDKHVSPNSVIEINKKIFVDEVLNILSTESPRDPDVINRLKELISAGEVRLKHQHFHRIKSRLNQELKVLVDAKQLVSVLEKNTYVPPVPALSLLERVKYLFFSKIENIKQTFKGKSSSLTKRRRPRQ